MLLHTRICFQFNFFHHKKITGTVMTKVVTFTVTMLKTLLKVTTLTINSLFNCAAGFSTWEHQFHIIQILRLIIKSGIWYTECMYLKLCTLLIYLLFIFCLQEFIHHRAGAQWIKTYQLKTANFQMSPKNKMVVLLFKLFWLISVTYGDQHM